MNHWKGSNLSKTENSGFLSQEMLHSERVGGFDQNLDQSSGCSDDSEPRLANFERFAHFECSAHSECFARSEHVALLEHFGHHEQSDSVD